MRGVLQRHFSATAPGCPCACSSSVIGRLLEDGDGEDLRQLVVSCGEESLVDWLRVRGGRQLSRRSRAFWVRVLGESSPEPPPTAEALWPL